MVRKKSVAAKVKTRKKAYQRRVTQLNKSCSWRVLVLVIQAAKKFLHLRRCKSCYKNLDCHCTISKEFLKKTNYKSLSNKTNDNISFEIIQNKQAFDDVKNILKTVVSKVCRLDYQRKRQSEISKRKRSVDDCSPDESVLRKRLKQNNWFNKKYNDNLLFRQNQTQQTACKSRKKYRNNSVFREKEKKRNRKSAIEKYNNNEEFREKEKTRNRKSAIEKYNNNEEFREKEKTRITKSTIERYNNNKYFREKEKIRMKRQMFNRYHINMNFRQQQKLRSNQNILFKYRNDAVIQEGPDYTCRVCGLALFRNQVIPYIEEKYITKNMSFEIKERIQYYLNN
ncbi:unnamed protein product, partial [Adineta steineri]